MIAGLSILLIQEIGYKGLVVSCGAGVGYPGNKDVLGFLGFFPSL